MSSESTVVLITGANSGVGFATAKVLTSSSAKYHVIVASRSLDKGKAAVESIQADSRTKGNVSSIQLDVTDERSIAAAKKKIESDFGRLDVLINNAGIYSKAPTLKEELEATLNTNLIGAALVTGAFTPLLLKSPHPYLLHISSGLGSLGASSDKGRWDYSVNCDAYRVSKAGLNMLMLQDWRRLEDKGVKVFAVCPGLVESNLRGEKQEERTAGGNAGSPEESGRLVLGILEGEKDGDVGKFIHKDGVYAW